MKTKKETRYVNYRKDLFHWFETSEKFFPLGHAFLKRYYKDSDFLRSMYFNSQVKKARKLMKTKGCEEEALFNGGMALMFGVDVATDMAEGFMMIDHLFRQEHKAEVGFIIYMLIYCTSYLPLDDDMYKAVSSLSEGLQEAQYSPIYYTLGIDHLINLNDEESYLTLINYAIEDGFIPAKGYHAYYLYNRGMYDKAYLLAKEAAEHNDKMALYTLGLFAYEGKAYGKNLNGAAEYFSKAARLNQPDACYEYAYMVLNKQVSDVKERDIPSIAYNYALRALDANHPDGTYLVAYMHLEGIKEDANELHGQLYLGKALIQGSLKALGYCDKKGYSTKALIDQYNYYFQD